jgi:hypothetical protein
MHDCTRITIALADGTRLTFKGREAWTLDKLIEAGPQGVRPIDRPAPRWSHYVMMIRRAGLIVETIRETHGGAFAGHHGRYVLHTPVTVVSIHRDQRRDGKAVAA